MKLIKIMAEEYARSSDRQMIHKEFWNKATEEHHVWIELPIKDAYEAGFRAARDMAANYSKTLNNRVESELGDLEYEEIMKMGEEEV